MTDVATLQVTTIDPYASEQNLAISTSSLPQRVFGQLVQMSQPLVEYYHSDLYHDALWLSRHLLDVVEHQRPFYFGADSHGTAIGTDRQFVEQLRENVWEMFVLWEDGKWQLYANRLR